MMKKGINDESVPVKCVEIGNGKFSSKFERMEYQIKQGCHTLLTDPDYADKEINIVGISQGGLISRGIVEQCEGLKVNTLFTWGGPL
jgi:triacylglycerol esterase/lipase EstA (alpha/beta hydrolase family)